MGALERLLESAKAAGPSDRIEFRDRIAAYGSQAIPLLGRWLSDSRLGAFAVRTLERIAREPADQGAVLLAFASVDLQAVSEPVARDIADAVARLGGTQGRSVVRKPSPISLGHWPGARDVSALEVRFHDEMLDIFRLAGEATRRKRPDGTTERGYWASYFLRGVRNHGGPAYARQLLLKAGTSAGFQRLFEEGRLDLSVEVLVLKVEYLELFSEDGCRIAAHRLAEAGLQLT